MSHLPSNSAKQYEALNHNRLYRLAKIYCGTRFDGTQTHRVAQAFRTWGDRADFAWLTDQGKRMEYRRLLANWGTLPDTLLISETLLQYKEALRCPDGSYKRKVHLDWWKELCRVNELRLEFDAPEVPDVDPERPIVATAVQHGVNEARSRTELPSQDDTPVTLEVAAQAGEAMLKKGYYDGATKLGDDYDVVVGTYATTTKADPVGNIENLSVNPPSVEGKLPIRLAVNLSYNSVEGELLPEDDPEKMQLSVRSWELVVKWKDNGVEPSTSWLVVPEQQAMAYIGNNQYEYTHESYQEALKRTVKFHVIATICPGDRRITLNAGGSDVDVGQINIGSRAKPAELA